MTRISFALTTVLHASLLTSYTVAQPLTTLYNFAGGTDGAAPVSDLSVDSTGTLYGTTSIGGVGACRNVEERTRCGTVFALAPPVSPGGAWTHTVLYKFRDGTDGKTPIGGVVFGKNGALYGTTTAGGVFGQGTVFELRPPRGQHKNWTEKLIYSFSGSDGAGPYGDLTFGKNGAIYGTTSGGGAHCIGKAPKCGTVFELAPPSSAGQPWTEAVLHSFSGPDGLDPVGGVVFGRNGVLYGATEVGGIDCTGTGQGCGVVFSLTPPASHGGAWTYHALYKFTGGNDGIEPGSLAHPVFGQNGVLYGTTGGGGAYAQGTVYALAPPGAAGGKWNETVLYSFSYECCGGNVMDGAYPNGGVVIYNGSLYGATQAGGYLGYGSGTIFQVSPPASPGGVWTETDLYNFKGTFDGFMPLASLTVGNSGVLYGTTAGLLTGELATVFEVTAP